MFAIEAQKLDKTLLLALGLMLLLYASWITFSIFLIVAVGTYAGLGWIQKYHPQHATRFLLILIPLQLAPLVYCKYGNFLANSLLALIWLC